MSNEEPPENEDVASGEAISVPDGGEDEEESGERTEGEQESGSGGAGEGSDADRANEERSEEETEDEEDGAKEAEGEVADEESEGQGTERGATVLYLDLEGLFLDVLGLEVDLHEVVLDIRAIPGDRKLLGNLLSAVAGLLGGGPLSRLLNRVLDAVSGLLNRLTSPIDWLGSGIQRARQAVPSLSPVDRVRSIASRVWSALTAPSRWIKTRLLGKESEEESEGEQRDDEEENDGIRDRLPTSGPSLPALPSRPSLPSPSSVFFGVANTVLDGLLALLGEQDSAETDDSEEGTSG